MVAQALLELNPLNFLLNQILICCRLSQILQLFNIFKESVSYLYFMILPFILVTGKQYRRSVLFVPTSLL
jgi:hypothetical protein